MSEPSALLITYSDVHSDSRLRRQIDWLAADGWSVDTFGLGPYPSDNVRDHFALLPQAAWVRTRIGGVLNYALLPSRARFRYLMRDRLPAQLAERIATGGYDLIVFDEYDFLPLLESRTIFTPQALSGYLHLDLHEYRAPRLLQNSIRRRLSDRYYRWRRGFIGHPAFDSRTTVSRRIAEIYAEDFGVEQPKLVRNSPPRASLSPSALDPGNIRLLFHGMASWARGFQEILAALPTIEERFTMTFMLTGDDTLISQVKEMAEPLKDRVRFIPPVAMTEVSNAVNEFDLEIMFFPSSNQSLRFALPNKLFEAVQGRLALIIGESPMMEEVVRAYDNGIVVRGWQPSDLAQAINALTPARIEAMKAASHRAADDLNAENEGRAFLCAINGAKNHRRSQGTAQR